MMERVIGNLNLTIKTYTQRETIETASFARRDLLLEKIGESFSSSGNEFGGSEDEEYFFSYSQSNIEALRDSLLGVILAGRQVIRCRRGKVNLIEMGHQTFFN